MATFNFTGFETGDLSELVSTNSSSGSVAISSSLQNTGSYGLSVSTSTAAGTAYALLASPAGNDLPFSDNSYYRVHVKFITLPSARYATFLGFNHNNSGVYSTTYQFAINFDGTISVYLSGTLLATGTTIISPGSYYNIEIGLLTGNIVQVRINGVTELSFTGSAVGTTNQLVLGKATNENSGHGIAFAYDDILISNSGFPGRGRSYFLLPNANGGVANWTPSSGTVANSYQLVTELPPDGDTTYITNNSSNVAHQFTLTSTLSRGIPANTPINAIKLIALTRSTSGGNNGAVITIVQGGSTVSGALNPSTPYAINAFVVDNSLATSTHWTTSELNALVVELISDATTNYRVTGFYLSVDFIVSDGVLVMGSADTTEIATIQGSSGVLLNGTALSGNIVNIVGSRGVAVAGSAQVTSYQGISGSSGVLLNGTATNTEITYQSGSNGVLLNGSAINTTTEVGSGGVLLAGSAFSTSGEIGSGGVLLNGTATITSYQGFSGSGGVLLGGTAVIGESGSTITGAGGVFLAGTAQVIEIFKNQGSSGVLVGGNSLLIAPTITGSGGVIINGQATNQRFANITWSGGVLVGGQGQPGQVYTSITASGGVLLNGTAPNNQGIVGLGGALAGGAAVLELQYYSAEPGGVLAGGISQQNIFIYNLALKGGVKLGGFSLIENLKVFTKIHTNYALCLNTDNIAKQLEAAKLVKDTIIGFQETPATPTPPVYVIPHPANYCDFSVQCADGILPEIVEDRQGVYIPPEISDPDQDVDLSH